MRNRLFAPGLALAFLFTLALGPKAAAQTAAEASHDWSAVASITPGQRIVVRLKEGDRLTGRFDSASDLVINFTHDGKKVSLTRESIQRVQTDGGTDRLKAALVGAAIGGGAALAFGGWVHSYGDFNSSIIYGPGLAGAGIGAGIGAAVGMGRTNHTVYEAP
ncbi:MAG: hypothetical protein QOC61_420 [Acidobacteriota bacterium]|jgi:hypothetical protein|nr:hypothetical protein [Acidobacteriota bacterium]MDT5261416.1 hypothetical protein [Acidobacteriota bacterium]MDT7777635.1 hypothetical protein [Acidobacteriota bacterium]